MQELREEGGEMIFRLVHQHARERAVAAVASPPDGYEVSISPPRKKRTLQANALYWKWIDQIRLHVIDTTGQSYSADAMHEWFKSKFLPTEVVEVNGEPIRCRLSTAKLSTKEMSDYMDMIDKYCANNLHLLLIRPEDKFL